MTDLGEWTNTPDNHPSLRPFFGSEARSLSRSCLRQTLNPLSHLKRDGVSGRIAADRKCERVGARRVPLEAQVERIAGAGTGPGVTEGEVRSRVAGVLE